MTRAWGTGRDVLVLVWVRMFWLLRLFGDVVGWHFIDWFVGVGFCAAVLRCYFVGLGSVRV